MTEGYRPSRLRRRRPVTQPAAVLAGIVAVLMAAAACTSSGTAAGHATGTAPAPAGHATSSAAAPPATATSATSAPPAGPGRGLADVRSNRRPQRGLHQLTRARYAAAIVDDRQSTVRCSPSRWSSVPR